MTIFMLKHLQTAATVLAIVCFFGAAAVGDACPRGAFD